MKRSMIPLFLFIFLPCLGQDSGMTIKYYGAFEGYRHPVTLVDELGIEVVKAGRRSYYVGEYDQDDLLIRMRKVFKDKKIYSYEYFYHPDGQLKEHKIYRKGKLIETISHELE